MFAIEIQGSRLNQEAGEPLTFDSEGEANAHADAHFEAYARRSPLRRKSAPIARSDYRVVAAS